ncbi:methyltransferase [Candidatus Uabimicrobium amorphum]|uniref:Hydroxyindole O-methyltransferase n=1 Tax=Uabimicrobium amorphum TaxID=2596890 RepID=A0A5S9II59_UABAM|nr:methyltransferase [Candidatus Uabimicrobium amorphum]BBM82278.1 hydroxyindole O-methyltransferase [Candidatus Uabimicrobium amorphum]
MDKSFALVQDLLIGSWKFQVVVTCLQLKIFEKLQQSATLQEVATQISAPEESTQKILTASVALGLLHKENEQYANTPATNALLVESSPAFMGNLFHHVCDVNPLWLNLTDAIRENSNRWLQTTGSAEGHFATLYKDPQRLRKFMETMHFFNEQVAKALAEVVDFSSRKAILDVGGATGILCDIIHKKYPHMQTTVYDLEEVCQISREFTEKYDTNIAFHSGNFLEEQLPSGFDVIYLGWVLHDWSTEIQLQLIEKCYEALPEGGMLLITENFLAEDGSGPLFTSLLSLDMLVSTDGGGESTQSQYCERLQQNGFRDIEVKEHVGGRSLIIAYKKI